MIAAKKPRIRRMGVSEARASFSNVLRRAQRHKETFVIENDGIVVAGIIGVDELEDFLDMNDSKLKKQIEESAAQYRRGEGSDGRALLAELESELRLPSRKRK
jgi:antitoxin (DNA-binding transcriptional repressor) of toxin-antitoxin stability system